MTSNAREQFLRIWPGIDPRVHLFENSLLKILAQLTGYFISHVFREFFSFATQFLTAYRIVNYY